MQLFVLYDEKCLRSERSNEQYGFWQEENDFSVLGVSISKPNYFEHEYETIETNAEVKPGDVVYVLSMIYSSGDSFGQATGKGEVLWVFKDAALAMRAKQKWVNEDEKDCREYSVEFEVDGGKKVKLNNPAFGYFENVQRVDVNAFLVNV